MGSCIKDMKKRKPQSRKGYNDQVMAFPQWGSAHHTHPMILNVHNHFSQVALITQPQCPYPISLHVMLTVHTHIPR